MNSKKIFTSLSFTVLGMILVFVFWQKASMLISFLILTGYIKHKILPIKKELTLYIISGLIGPFVESFIMQSGAWAYSYSDIANFPVWLPFLWGLAGILGISLYEGITEK